MSENFILYLISILGGLILGGIALYHIGLKHSTEDLRTETKKIQLLINQAKSDLKGIPRSPEALLGGMDPTALMEELGIDPGILKNPLVKGLIDRYAPKLIEQISKKGENEIPKGFM
jgi:hypothetical protein